MNDRYLQIVLKKSAIICALRPMAGQNGRSIEHSGYERESSALGRNGSDEAVVDGAKMTTPKVLFFGTRVSETAPSPRCDLKAPFRSRARDPISFYDLERLSAFDI